MNTSDLREPEYPLSYLLPNGKIFVLGPTQGITRTLDVNAQTWTAGPNLPLTSGSAAYYRPGKGAVRRRRREGCGIAAAGGRHRPDAGDAGLALRRADGVPAV